MTGRADPRAQWITPEDDPLVAKRGHEAELPCLTHWPVWRRTCGDCREIPPEALTRFGADPSEEG